MGINTKQYQNSQYSKQASVKQIKMGKFVSSIALSLLTTIARAAPSINRAALLDTDVYDDTESMSMELAAVSNAEEKLPKMDGAWMEEKHNIQLARIEADVLDDDYSIVGESAAQDFKLKMEGVSALDKSESIRNEKFGNLNILSNADY